MIKMVILFTSLPYQKGYTIIIDGKKVTPEIVNKAFLGCPISKGKHKITIEFKAPGKQLGLTLTIISSLIWGYLLWKKEDYRIYLLWNNRYLYNDC